MDKAKIVFQEWCTGQMIVASSFVWLMNLRKKSPPDCHMSTIFKIYQYLLRIAALTNLIFIIEINNYQVAQRLH